MKIKEMRCEYRDNPLGIDIQQPRFSWQLDSSIRGVRQTRFQIVCYPWHKALDAQADPYGQNVEILWDSGEVESSQSIHIPYEGPALQSRQRVAWQVRAWDDNQQATPWSPAAWFEMGLLSPQDWQATWIGTGHVGGPYTAAPCPYMRKRFSVRGQIKDARLYISALGLYEPYLNGQRVGLDIFTPGWTDYNQRVQYQVYDVTSLLATGDNTLGAILGDGWYCGKVGWEHRQIYGDRPRLLAQLEIKLADGSHQVIGTDTSWETTTGALLESDLIMGEAYDARRENPGWCAAGQAGTATDSVWMPALELPIPENLALVAQNGPSMRTFEQLTPIAVPDRNKSWPVDRWIFDFGQNLVGRVRLKVKGKAGDTIILRFGEMLDEDGNLYTENLRSARQTDYYTLRGDPQGETYESHFTFHGFRYAEISGYQGEPGRDTLTAVVIHSDNNPTLEFECSNPLVNQLQHNIRWGWWGNSLDVPTDCPQRDERLGWMGDGQVFAQTATYLCEAAGFFTRWIQDMVDAQLESGAAPSFAPSPFNYRIYDGGPAWSDAFIIVPWTIWQQYSDTHIIEKHFEAMCRYLDYLVDNSPGYIRLLPSAAELDNDPANEQIGGYGDWLAKDGSSDRRGLTPKDLIGTAFLAYDARLMSQMAAAINRVEDSERFSQLYADVRQAFIQHFITPAGNLSGQTQTAYVLALHFDLVPEELRETVFAKLLKDIEITRELHISTGFVGTPYICQVLTDYGRTDIAYALLQQKTWPSWLYSVVHGATTIWEHWDGWTEDTGFQNPSMNSFNHYAYGAIGTWMVENILGIRTDPGNPGFQRILLQPRPGGEMTYARGAYQSPYGRIESEWELSGDSFTWKVTVPPNTSALATLSARPGDEIQEGGTPAAESLGVEMVAQSSESIVFKLQPGHYHFTVHS